MLYKKSSESIPAVTDAFRDYLEEIKMFDKRDATEHTLRPALHNLLIALARLEKSNISVIPEPKRDESGRGAPDVKFKIGGTILGYLENKKTNADLDQVLKSEQIAKYKKLSDNLIVTNYIEWVWLKKGAVIARERLAYHSDIGNRKAHLDPDKVEKTYQLIAGFYSMPPKGIASVEDLALALATRCHTLREFLSEELTRQEEEHQKERLFGLFNVFKKDVFHELSLAMFADAFAQMLGYGLFLARLNSGEKSHVTLINAKQYIPVNFGLIRELVNFLDELEKPEYSRIKWLIEEILSIMNTLNLPKILEGLHFTKRQGRLIEETEEERLIFAKDPYVYFYEDFLKAYDAKMRKARGIYYTPPPVVNFIIRGINDILRDVFDIKTGLADRKRVTVLDFATGTGTFLLEVVQQLLDIVPEGLRIQIIREHALKNLYGFEYLIAPYTIAHLKLSQFLDNKGFTMQPKERLQIYLTNTLEPITPQLNLLLPALSKEVEHAQEVKEKPILVITGNPPYSGSSKNPSSRINYITTKGGKTKKVKTLTFIGKLIEDYKKVDGKSLGERNPKWLQDDYVKFIRFAQWKMDQVDEGVVGIITNHSFLDNPTFRGMRQSLMRTFNQIYLLDLHGNRKKKETTPDGGKDENVFDIEQGVCISLLVRGQSLKRRILHSDLWGKRIDKYRACMKASFDKVHWVGIHPRSPEYLFIPQNTASRHEYEQGQKVTDIFRVNVLGFQTHRDHFAIAFDRDDIRERVRNLIDKKTSEVDLMAMYNIKDSGDWNLNEIRKSLRDNKEWSSSVIMCAYRPFDQRFCYFGYEFMDRPRRELLEHVAFRENICLGVGKSGNAIPERPWELATISRLPMDANIYRRGGVNVFPLYLYKPSDDKKAKPGPLFSEPDPFDGKDRIENFTPSFRQFIDEKYGKRYKPEEILAYIYAVLYSPTYRNKYAEFLKRDFPRIPFVDKRKAFEKISELGRELIQAHLLNDIPSKPRVDVTKGSDQVETLAYNGAEERLYINKQQYFAPVPEDVSTFYIGGYQVLEMYLKSRKERQLSLDEKENIISLIKVLSFTIDQMTKIDKALSIQ